MLQSFSGDLPSLLQGASADTFRSLSILIPGINLRVNNAGTKKGKKYQREGITASKHAYIFTFRTVMF